MLDSIRFLLDLAIVIAAALSGVFWYQASQQSLRRIEKRSSTGWTSTE